MPHVSSAGPPLIAIERRQAGGGRGSDPEGGGGKIRAVRSGSRPPLSRHIAFWSPSIFIFINQSDCFVCHTICLALSYIGAFVIQVCPHNSSVVIQWRFCDGYEDDFDPVGRGFA